MIAIKVKNLIVQIILTVISFCINLIVVVPIGLLVTGGWKELIKDNPNGIIMIPLMFVICSVGFVLNRLIFTIKGKQTEYILRVWVEEYLYTERQYDEYKHTLTITDYYKVYSEYKSELTAWGWLATFLAFVAFPMRLVSLIMAFAAIFSDRIFVTHRRLDPETPVCKSAVFTHSLFDFVIMPKSFTQTEGEKNKKSIPFILLYVAFFLILNILAMQFIGGRERFAWSEAWATTVSLLMGIIVIIVDLILLIKHSILLGKAYTRKKALITIIKIVIPPLIWMIFNLIFFA